MKKNHKVTDKIIKEYSIKCGMPSCGKIITGRSISECDLRLQNHYYFKHRSKNGDLN